MYKINKRLFFTSLFVLMLLVCAAFTSYHYITKGKNNPDIVQTGQQNANVLITSNIIRNQNILEGFHSTMSQQFSPSPLHQTGETALRNEEYLSVSQKDGIYATTESSQTFPYQQYQIRTEHELSADQKLTLSWEGKSNRIVDLYAWDYSQQIWVNIPESISRNDNNLILKADIVSESLVKDNIVTILVATIQKNNLLYVNTYSPYLDDYNFYDTSREEFILPLTQEKGEILLSTDYINIEK